MLPDVKAKTASWHCAEWLTSKENVLFPPEHGESHPAEFLRRGIVEPVDDVRISNPPSNRD